jgi:thiamine-monophosphate kinase
VGDLVCVTGALGDAGAGLALLEAGRNPGETPAGDPLFRAHFRPEPPVAAARALAASSSVTAMMDLSDGLASDLRHICDRSGVGARILASEIPISEAARSAAGEMGREALDWALRGGEDYQLLFTLASEARDALPGLLRDTGTSATVVGEITTTGYVLVRVDGSEEPLSPNAFDHFAGAEPGGS